MTKKNFEQKVSNLEHKSYEEDTKGLEDEDESERRSSKSRLLNSKLLSKHNIQYLVYAVIPEVCFLALYYIKPDMVMDKNRKIDKVKFALWFIVLTLIGYGIYYGIKLHFKL